MFRQYFDKLRLTGFCHVDPAEGGRNIDKKRIYNFNAVTT